MWGYVQGIVQAAGAGILAFLALGLLVIGWTISRLFGAGDRAAIGVGVFLALLVSVGAVPFITRGPSGMAKPFNSEQAPSPGGNQAIQTASSPTNSVADMSLEGEVDENVAPRPADPIQRLKVNGSPSRENGPPAADQVSSNRASCLDPQRQAGSKLPLPIRIHFEGTASDLTPFIKRQICGLAGAYRTDGPWRIDASFLELAGDPGQDSITQSRAQNVIEQLLADGVKGDHITGSKGEANFTGSDSDEEIGTTILIRAIPDR